MKRKLFSVLGLAFLVQTFFFGAANAEYLEEQDRYIYIQTGNGTPERFPLDEKTAQLMFDKQEDRIETLEKITGRELDHYYIWVVFNGEKILAIDPPAWHP